MGAQADESTRREDDEGPALAGKAEYQYMERIFGIWFRRYAGHRTEMEPTELVSMIEDVESEFGRLSGLGSPEWMAQLVTDPQDPAYKQISKLEFVGMMIEIGTAEGSRFTYEDMTQKTVEWAQENELEIEGFEESDDEDRERSVSSEDDYGTPRQRRAHQAVLQEKADFSKLLQGNFNVGDWCKIVDMTLPETIPLNGTVVRLDHYDEKTRKWAVA